MCKHSEIQENRQIFALFHTQKLPFFASRTFSSSVPRGEKSSNIYSLIFIFSPALKTTKSSPRERNTAMFLPRFPQAFPMVFQRDVTPILAFFLFCSAHALFHWFAFFPPSRTGQVSRFSFSRLQFGTISDFLDQLARLSNFECRLGCAAQLGQVC